MVAGGVHRDEIRFIFLAADAAKDSITGFVKHLLDWSLIYLGSAQQRGRFYRTKALATMSKGIIHTWSRLQPIYNLRRLGCWPPFSNYSAVYQIQSIPLLYRLFFHSSCTIHLHRIMKTESNKINDFGRRSGHFVSSTKAHAWDFDRINFGHFPSPRPADVKIMEIHRGYCANHKGVFIEPINFTPG